MLSLSSEVFLSYREALVVPQQSSEEEKKLRQCGSLKSFGTNMPSAGLQILGTFLATIGFLGDIVICALPMWKVSAFIGNNIVTAQIFWEGLWMNCVMQSTGQMQCKVYDSMLALPQDLQAARALVVISILVVFMGILLSVAGGKCTNCIDDEMAKSKVAIAAGVFFIVGGILCLIPVSWSANEVIKNFYNPIVNDAQRRELGASLFIGWGSAGLLFIGGALLCCQCQQGKDSRYSVKYSAPRSAASGGAYTQLVGVCLAIIGLLGTILICGLPMWKVTAFIEANIVTAQVFWEGLWMNCVIQSTGHSQCKAYDSILALPRELQASRALICVSIAVSVVAIGLTVVGARCTIFFRDDRLKKANIGLAGGVVFILAGILCIIPVSWSAYSIITDLP
ncbi:hypothetical protein L3Q82_006524 [Scortum barcoo]|uniref:Uncharacterized protein n=1 Tax=Scortum barcoo TaxID=214431 RepID=A0ACB8X0X1_9TELE|nr:hypothetical protein L3Q82_006524 [Scortum barcoo]